MKTELRFRHTLSSEKVREFCIHHDLYTRGDNEAYGKMLDKCGYITPETLEQIAQDIVDHTPADHPLIAQYEPVDEIICYLCDFIKVETYLHMEHEPGDKTIRARCVPRRR